jgi:hypothetical protein
MHAFKCKDTSPHVRALWSVLDIWQAWRSIFCPVAVFLVPSVRLSIHAFCNVALCRLLGNSVALKDFSALEISVFYTVHTV